MADISWIKLTTDMFDNRKIKNIRSLPEGNNIVLIWVMLLTMAGRCNAGGMIFLTETIPYTVDSLSNELNFESSVIKMAIKVLSDFGMIICNENEFCITNWGEYQNVEGMDKVKLQNRERQKRYRENQKLLSSNNATDNVTVTLHNAIEEDIEEDKDIKKENKNNIKGVFQEFAGDDKALLEALKEFNSFRNLKKKPMTDAAKRRLLNKLEEEFPKEQWIDIIHQSIDNGWTDIYGLKGSDRYDTRGSGQKQSVHTNAPESSGSGGKQWNLKHN